MFTYIFLLDLYYCVCSDCAFNVDVVNITELYIYCIPVGGLASNYNRFYSQLSSENVCSKTGIWQFFPFDIAELLILSDLLDIEFMNLPWSSVSLFKQCNLLLKCDTWEFQHPALTDAFPWTQNMPILTEKTSVFRQSA